MDDIAPPNPASAAAAPPAVPAKAKDPVGDLHALIDDFETKMREAQTKQFEKMKKGFARLLAAPVILRIGGEGFVLESFADPEVFFSLGAFNESHQAAYERVFGKGKSGEQYRAILAVADAMLLCMERIGFFTANNLREIRIVA